MPTCQCHVQCVFIGTLLISKRFTKHQFSIKINLKQNQFSNFLFILMLNLNYEWYWGREESTWAGEECCMRWRRFDVDCTVCEICSATTAFAELSPPVAAFCVDIGRHSGLRLFAAVGGSWRRCSIFFIPFIPSTFFTAHNFLLNFISSICHSWSAS